MGRDRDSGVKWGGIAGLRRNLGTPIVDPHYS